MISLNFGGSPTHWRRTNYKWTIFCRYQLWNIPTKEGHFLNRIIEFCFTMASCSLVVKYTWLESDASFTGSIPTNWNILIRLSVYRLVDVNFTGLKKKKFSNISSHKMFIVICHKMKPTHYTDHMNTSRNNVYCNIHVIST